MSSNETPSPAANRRTARRAATRDDIVDAAWTLAREQGLAGITMRDLGARVGMKAQSLYSYFGSKRDIYDAMFEQGYRSFAEWMSFEGGLPPTSARAHAQAHRYFEFCVTDPVRFQLLFQRTIPGFEPSAQSYALAVQVLESMTADLAELGVGGAAAVDMWTAVMTGLSSQQIANDPGGSRWQRLVDAAVEMLLAHAADAGSTPPETTTTRRRTRSAL